MCGHPAKVMLCAIPAQEAFSLNDAFAPVLAARMEFYNTDPSADAIRFAVLPGSTSQVPALCLPGARRDQSGAPRTIF